MSQLNKTMTWTFMAFSSLVLMSAPALAGPSAFSYEGRVFDTYGNPSQDSVSFTVQVFNPAANCMLREETSASLNLATSNGYFTVSVGSNAVTSNDAGLSAQTLFSNRSALTGVVVNSGSSNSACTYTPNTSDGRVVRIIVNDATVGTTTTMTPDISVGSSPYAISADTLQGLSPSALVAVNSTSAQLTQANLESVFLNTAAVTNLQAVANGQFVKNSSSTGTPVTTVTGTPTAPATGAIWYNTATNSLQYYNGTSALSLGAGSSGTVTSVSAGTGLTGGPITTSGSLSLAATGTAGTYAKVTTDAYGRVQNGSSLIETDLPTIVTAGKVSGSALTAGTIAGTTSMNTSGAITTTGVVTAGSITSNAAATQSSKIYNTGNTFAATLTVPQSLSMNYNLVLPSNTGTSGNVLSTDGAGNTSWVAGGGAPSGTAAGDLAGTYPNPVVAKLNGTNLSTSGLNPGNFIRYNGSTWQNANIAATDMPTTLQPGPGTSTAPSHSFASDSATGMFSPVVSNIGFSTAGSERMRISNSGLVGIGNISPAYTLDVTGTGRFAGSLLAPSLTGGTSSSGNLTIDSTTGTPKGSVLIASAGGNVGVGTTSPSGVFSSYGTSTATTGSQYNLNNTFMVAPTASSSATYYGNLNLVSSSSPYLGGTQIWGSQDQVNFSGTSLSSGTATSGNFQNVGSGTVTSAFGGRFQAGINGGGSITNAYATQNTITTTGSGSITSAYGSFNGINSNSGTTITNAYAAYSTVPTGSGGAITNAYGLYIGDMTGATNRYGVYEFDSSPNFFAGKVGIGTSSPTSTLQVTASGSTATASFISTGNSSALSVTGSPTAGSAAVTVTNSSGTAAAITANSSGSAATVLAYNTGTGPALQVGSSNTGIVGLQICSYTTVASNTPSSSAPFTYNFSCSNVPATGAVVNCSPSGLTVATGVTWSAYASAAGYITINVSSTLGTGTAIPSGTAWRCTAMY